MKTTVIRNDFVNAFRGRNNFSVEALGLLFDYFEDYEQDTGEELELDVITICCDYNEDTVENIAETILLILKIWVNMHRLSLCATICKTTPS